MLFLLCCAGVPLAILAAGAGGFWFGKHLRSDALETGTNSAVVETTQSGGVSCSEGPWGKVEYERVVIKTPREITKARGVSKQDGWFFKGYSVPQLTGFFAGIPLSAEEKTGLLQTDRWEATSAGVRLNPTPQTILALSPTARKSIYQVLAQCPENTAQANPYHWLAGDQETLFNTCGLSGVTRSELKRLCYRRGSLVMFADLETLLPRLSNEAERDALVEMLSSELGVLLRLNVTPDTDIDALVRYWGVAGLGKSLRPVLEAASRTEGGRRIPVLGLLPLSMRARIYTFPSSTADLELDGYWTAANFLSQDPRPEKIGVLEWLRRCKAEYHPLGSDPRFGDVLMLTRADGRLLHSCVYLADDIVFTKNAAGTRAPWMLMKVSDLLGHFSALVPETEGLRVSYVRNKAI